MPQLPIRYIGQHLLRRSDIYILVLLLHGSQFSMVVCDNSQFGIIRVLHSPTSFEMGCKVNILLVLHSFSSLNYISPEQTALCWCYHRHVPGTGHGGCALPPAAASAVAAGSTAVFDPAVGMVDPSTTPGIVGACMGVTCSAWMRVG